MWSDAAVTRFVGGRPHTREEVWARLLRYIGHWHAIGYGYWIVEAPDGAYLGEVGFADYRRDITPPLDRGPELGWVIVPGAWGRGLATEAAALALTWRDERLPPGDTVCIIAPGNDASLRVAQKLGFLLAGEARYHDRQTLVLRRS